MKMIANVGDIISSAEQLSRMHTQLKTQGLSTLQHDALILHQFLTPTITIRKETNQAGESIINECVTSLTDLKNKKQLPDALFIFGNNDIRQIDHIANLYRDKALQDSIKKIFISGKGGHGTTDAPIFGQAEAQSMRFLFERRFPLENIQGKIVTENEAKNSGENIEKIDALMKTNPHQPFQHILISSTPAGIRRQLLSYEKQSTNDWKQLTVLPSSSEIILKKYYSNPIGTGINMMYALREMGTFLDYSVNTVFLPNRMAADQSQLKKAIHIFVNYYNLLVHPKKRINNEILIQLFLKFDTKLLDIKSDDMSKLAEQVKHMADYFRVAFNMIEERWMKKLSSELTLEEQSAQIQAKDYARLGIDPVRLLNNKQRQQLNLSPKDRYDLLFKTGTIFSSSTYSKEKKDEGITLDELRYK